MKEKTEVAAFNYSTGLKDKTGRDGRVSKIAKIEYERLEMQQYLSENKTTMISKFIVKARSCTLDIKTQKAWKYEDKTCVGCELKEETGNEVLNCELLGNYSKMFLCAKEMMKRLKVRQKIIEKD